jgi:hypothetical protein
LIHYVSKRFYVVCSAHTVSQILSAQYSVSTGAVSPGVKWPGRQADRSPSDAEAKSTWSYISRILPVFTEWCLAEHRNVFTFYFFTRWLEQSQITCFQDSILIKLKNKTIPVTGRGDLYGCEMLRIPHCLDSRLTDGGAVVSLTRRLRSAPRSISSVSGTHLGPWCC